jgi:hypothetical protein
VTAFRARQQRGREGLVQNSMVSPRS